MASPFHNGFPFKKPQSEQPANPVVAAPASSPPGSTPGPISRRDRRRAPRQTLVAKASVRPDTPVISASLVSTGFVSNISLNGVGFHTRRPLAIGEKYRISVEVGPMKWTSRMRVVSCHSHNQSNTFDIGAEFVGNDLIRERMIAA